MNTARISQFVLQWLIGLLVLTAFLSVVRIEIGSVTVNPSQILGGFLVIILAGAAIVTKTRVPFLFTDNVSILIYLYFGSNLLSSLLVSNNRASSLKDCLVILSYVFVYTLTRAMMKFVNNKRDSIYQLMTLNVLSALFGLGCMVYATLYGWSWKFGVSYGHLSIAGNNSLENPPPSIYSLSLEPNMFAIITASILFLHIAIYMIRKNSRLHLLIMAVLSLAILLAYTRSVYVAIALVLLVVVVLLNRLRTLFLIIGFGFIWLVAVATFIYMLPEDNSIRIGLSSRLSTLVDFKSGTGLGRMAFYETGVKGFQESPLIGQGTITASTHTGAHGWLTGLWIQSLHDTGLLGFGIVGMLCAFLIYDNLKVFRKLDPESVDRALVLGFLGGNLLIIITAQLSSCLWVAFPWIYWGINMSYLAWCRTQLKANL